MLWHFSDLLYIMSTLFLFSPYLMYLLLHAAKTFDKTSRDFCHSTINLTISKMVRNYYPLKYPRRYTKLFPMSKNPKKCPQNYDSNLVPIILLLLFSSVICPKCIFFPKSKTYFLEQLTTYNKEKKAEERFSS